MNKRLLVTLVSVVLALGLAAAIIEPWKSTDNAQNTVEMNPDSVSDNSLESSNEDFQLPPELTEAQEALKQKDFEKAEALFTEAFKKYPDSQIGPASSVRSEAAEGISYIRCLKLANPEIVYFKSPDEALHEVLNAVAKNDFLKLFTFTGCSFAVGFWESDNFWNLDVPSAIKALVGRLSPLQNSNWKFDNLGSTDQMFGSTEFEGRTIVLHFAHQAEGWKWNGFFASAIDRSYFADLQWSGEKIYQELQNSK